MSEHIVFAEPSGLTAATTGSAGLATQLPGQPTTIGAVASATGGIAPGHLAETAIG